MEEYFPINTLYIEVTHACNQSCKHCYLGCGPHRTIEEMSTEQVLTCIRYFKEQGGRYIIITGGEPIIRKDIFIILDYIEELAIPFTFASNGLAMTNERLTKLSGYKFLELYFTSILGVNATNHRFITTKDSYNKSLNAISFFSEKGISVYVQVTLANDYLDDMEQIADNLITYQNCTIKFTPISSFGIKNEPSEGINQKLLVKGDRINHFMKLLDKIQKKYPDRIENSNFQSLAQIKQERTAYENTKLHSLSYGFIAIRPNGDISFSVEMNNPYTFGKAYDSLKVPIDEVLLSYIDELRTVESIIFNETAKVFVEWDAEIDKYLAERR